MAAHHGEIDILKQILIFDRSRIDEVDSRGISPSNLIKFVYAS